MEKMTRRAFLALGARTAALFGLSAAAGPGLARALAGMADGSAPVIWLQGQSCSGCSVSLLNSEAPGPAELLTDYIHLLFHGTLSAATGATAEEVVAKSVEQGGYYLVFEGAVPLGMPTACAMGGKPVADLLDRAARGARAVLAVGTCASFGGIPAAENNPTGAVSVPDFLRGRGFPGKIARLPGCPCHPDWVVGTLAHIIRFGMPQLDELNRPTAFYGRIIHDQCPRFSDYEREKFAAKFGDEGCLFKLGCLGPETRADCSSRLWNGGINYCVRAGGPCIGCASEHFALTAGFPFYTKDRIKPA